MASPASTSVADPGASATGIRSYLYVPGDRPDMLARAAGRGADALVIDLEDGALPRAKAAARRHVSDWLDTLTVTPGGPPGGPQVWVRINPEDGALRSPGD